MLKIIPLLVAGLVSLLASCTTDMGSTAVAKAACDAEAAANLVGKPKLTDREVMRVTSSKIVRQIEPGQAVTHDFREDRVTIETDRATGRVVGARCG